MSNIKKLPSDKEIKEAAGQAMDYFIEVGILKQSSSILEEFLDNCLKNFFDVTALADENCEDPPSSIPGNIMATNLLVINNQRYWLTNKEWKKVEKIKLDYPNKWEDVVLQKMATLSL